MSPGVNIVMESKKLLAAGSLGMQLELRSGCLLEDFHLEGCEGYGTITLRWKKIFQIEVGQKLLTVYPVSGCIQTSDTAPTAAGVVCSCNTKLRDVVCRTTTMRFTLLPCILEKT
jgi:hypothetical protein